MLLTCDQYLMCCTGIQEILSCSVIQIGIAVDYSTAHLLILLVCCFIFCKEKRWYQIIFSIQPLMDLNKPPLMLNKLLSCSWKALQTSRIIFTLTHYIDTQKPSLRRTLMCCTNSVSYARKITQQVISLATLLLYIFLENFYLDYLASFFIYLVHILSML